jgi:hypothetical protein
MNMKDKPKLGRGLDDVSQHFLSSIPPRPSIALATPAWRSVAVCHPGSLPLQSCLLTNLALELAKRRHQVKVIDFSPPGEARIKTLMGAIFPEEDSPGHAIVHLYGLPRIEIIESNTSEAWLENQFTGRNEDPPTGVLGRYFLANAPGPLEFFIKSMACNEYILATKTDENSLLQAYAFCKVIRDKGALRIHLVFDDAQPGEQAERIFRQFAGFVGRRLGCTLRLLGNLVHDERIQRSIKEHMPLVLYQGGTGAGIRFSEICERLFEAENQTEAHTPKEALCDTLNR